MGKQRSGWSGGETKIDARVNMEKVENLRSKFIEQAISKHIYTTTFALNLTLHN